MSKYRLNPNDGTKTEQHKARIERLVDSVDTDPNARDAVEQSRKFLEDNNEQSAQISVGESTNNPDGNEQSAQISVGESTNNPDGNGNLVENSPSASREPNTCLILTVGTNALPVWVAWHHLKNFSEELPPPIHVQLVHTKKTKPEMKRLRKEINEYYENHSSEGFVKNVQTSPGDPYMVFKDITQILNDLPSETEHIHVHYTGGTQVMGVETVSAATRFVGRKEISTSYLTVHADSGPAIKGLKLVWNTESNTVEHSLMDFRKDTRVGIVEKGIDLKFLGFVASLNGFEIGPFTHTSSQGRVYKRPAPVQFKGEYLTIGKHLLECVNKSQIDGILQLRRKWATRNYQTGGDFSSNLSLWQDIVFPFFKEIYSDLECLTWNEETSTLSYPARAAVAHLPEVQRELFKGIAKFFNSTWFEYAIAAAFHSALCKIDDARRKENKEDNGRSEYAIFHNVHVQRTPTEDSVSVKDFELDVVAMLGHQIVVVSCTTDQGQGLEGLIKQKGMEVLHRARQLGGDEARGIVLCQASQNEAKLVDDELKDETGGASEPLQIWGLDKWSNLTQEFECYCEELRWQ